MKEIPAALRPREKLLQGGPQSLSDVELLAILLRTGLKGQGVLEMAQALLERFGGLSGLLRAEPEALRTVRGLGGAAKRAELLAVARRHPNITLRERWMALDLITSRHVQREDVDKGVPRVYGVYALDIDAQRVETLPARSVVLATGGAGKVYRYTTNPDTSTGDGIAMAWRAGCRVANMEFIQFHPTCLYHPQERSFLITEALRGEGGLLRWVYEPPARARGQAIRK